MLGPLQGRNFEFHGIFMGFPGFMNGKHHDEPKETLIEKK